MDTKTAQKCHLETIQLRRVLTGGKHVKRYYIDRPDLWIIYTARTDDWRKLPNICAYIDRFKNDITCREVEEKKHPLYSLHRPRKEKLFLKDEKLLGVITEDEIIVTLDDIQTFATDGLYLFAVRNGINAKYVMAILNSKMFVFLYRLLAIEKGRVLAQVKPTTLYQLPIRAINFSDSADKSRHDKMVKLVERMLALHKHLAKARTEHEKTAIKRQIDATDRQIDGLVYGLYGFTEEEVAIVEGRE